MMTASCTRIIFPALNCTSDPPSVSHDRTVDSGWDGSSRGFGHEVRYACTRSGWGFPSTGSDAVTAVCQASGVWSLEEVESCQCEYF